MSYQTGSAADLPSLMTIIKDFALAEGWTIGKYVTSGTIANNLLFMSKGQCFVALQGVTVSMQDWTTGANVPINDNRLRGALATSLNNSLNTYFGHPGSAVTAATSAERIEINDLAGPFTSYHLFSDPTVSDYINVVVQTAPDRWQHFGFGNLDKGTFTHSGAGYITGISRAWVPNRSGSITSNSGVGFNKPGHTKTGFVFGLKDNDLSDPANEGSDRVAHIYAPDALPLTAGWTAMLGQGWSSNSDTNSNFINNCRFFSTPLSSLYSQLTNRGTLNAHVGRNFATSFSGVAPMFGLPVIYKNSSVSASCYVGDFPNVRQVNMEGLLDAQTLTFGADEWMVFPCGRQTAWMTAASMGMQFSSGRYGLAHKKVV